MPEPARDVGDDPGSFFEKAGKPPPPECRGRPCRGVKAIGKSA